jgi:hypothetical protein
MSDGDVTSMEAQFDRLATYIAGKQESLATDQNLKVGAAPHPLDPAPCP